MPLSFLGGLAQGSSLNGDAAAAIPGALLSKKDLPGTAAALEFLAVRAGPTGVLPKSDTDLAPDPMANLWFIRAVHLFAQAGGDKAVVAGLLPLSKRILQEFIGGGLGGVKMDDGGLLLATTEELAAQGLRLNALWYSALESTAADLKAAGDKAGDHFERLAGRFRRAFAKSYWCDGHNCVCPPYRRSPESHGELTDADQLLLTVLPASPIPRTKQRQLLQLVRSKSQAGVGKGEIGLLIDHPVHGRVESVLHRAWLAMGLLNAADNPAAVMAEAAAVIAPVERAMSEAHGGLAAFYKDGRPVGGAADALTKAEVMGAVRQVRGG